MGPDGHAARWRQVLHPHRQVDAIPEQVVAMHQDVGHHDAGAHLEDFPAGGTELPAMQLLLDACHPFDRRDDAGEFGQKAIAHGLEHGAAALADPVDEMRIGPAHQTHRLPLVVLHETGESDHVYRHDRNQPALRFGHDETKTPDTGASISFCCCQDEMIPLHL